MPKAPSWIDKVNYVVTYWQDPCHAPLLVYLELALPPAGDALLTWFSFGLDDVLRGFLRPSKALGGGAFKRRGKEKIRKSKFFKATGRIGRVLKAVPGIGDDLGNWIGKNLPGAQEIKGRVIQDGERFLWLIDDVAQRALLALLIADVLLDFAYEWATLLNESEFCKRDHADTLYATGPGSPTGFPFGCLPNATAVVVFAEGNVGWHGNTGGCGPGRHTAVTATQVTNSGPSPILYQQRVHIADDAGTRDLFSPAITIGAGQSAGSVFNIPLTGNAAFTVDHCAFGGGVSSQSHDVAIWGSSQ